MAAQTAEEHTVIAPPAERRRAARFPNVCEAWVRSPTDGEDARMEVLSLDISRHGVGFESHHRLAEGCFYWVELNFGDQHIASEIRVTSCTEIEGCPGVWRVGGEFC